MKHKITREQIKHRLDNHQPMKIVEALPQKYFDDGHLPGAINIPHDEIDDKADEVLSDMEEFIVIYCANTACQNALMATNTLLHMGYKNVYEYVEGKQDWIEAGLTIEKIQMKEVG